MGIENEYDVVVVGAGATGCCSAIRLAQDHDVLVLEKEPFATNASANANAFVSEWWYLLQGDRIPGVAEAVREFFEDLDGTGEFEYNRIPCIVLVDDGEDMDDPENKFRKMKDSAGDIEGMRYYDRDDLADRWPDTLNLEGFRGGVVDEKGACIAPDRYLEAMRQVAEDRGVEFRTETEVTDIVTDGDAARGVVVDGSEEIRSDAVVVAAGTHSKGLLSEFVDLPVRQFVIYGNRIEPNHIDVDDAPCVSGRGLFVGPDPYGSLTLVGGEYWIDDFEKVDKIAEEFPEECRDHVANRLPQVYQGFEDRREIDYVPGEIHRCPEGITITPDQLPVIDTIGDVENLVVADGSRGAVSMAPAMSKVVRSLLTGEDGHIPHEPFEIDRFDATAEYDLPLITDPPEGIVERLPDQRADD